MAISLGGPITLNKPVTTTDDFRKVCATNSEQGSAFATRIPTTTKPSGDCIIDRESGVVSNYLMIIPFGTQADGARFSIRVLGWSNVAGADGDIWIPVKLLNAAECILGTAQGVDGSNVIAGTGVTATFIADTITTVTGTDLVEVVSPADNTVAHLTLDTKGFEIIEVFFLRNTADSCNALYREF